MPAATPVRFDEHTALIVVDVQNDFADPSGSLYVSGGERIVPAINALIADACQARAQVVYTQDWHPERTPHFRQYGGTWPVHCVHGTWGAEFHPELTLDGAVVQKGIGGEDGYSGFASRDPVTGETRATDLERILRAANVRRVIVAGLATDWCVKQTALDGRRLGFETVMLKDACRAVNQKPDDESRALAEMRQAGVIVQ